MAILSTVRTLALASHAHKVLTAQQFRHAGGHARTLPIFPSTFQWNKFKDLLHLYFLVGLIPLGALVTYSNLFIGKAELSDIPKGYVPQAWEYERHPITRFFVQHFTSDPIRKYEERVAHIAHENDVRLIHKAGQEVDAVMERNQDYRSRYFIPFDRFAQYARYNKVRTEAHKHATLNDN